MHEQVVFDTLLPDIDKPLRGFSSFSTAVGSFYQILASQVLHGENLVTDNRLTICPDVLLLDGKTIAEVKASSTKQAFRLRIDQVNDYCNLNNGGFRTLYCLFEHGGRDGYKRIAEKTVKCAVGMLAKSTRYLVVLDLSVILRLAEVYPPVRDTMFSICLNLSHTVVKGFATNPIEAFKGLGLPLSEYIITVSEIKDMQVAGELVEPFPVVYIFKKERYTVSSRPVNFKEIRSQFISDTPIVIEEEERPF